MKKLILALSIFSCISANAESNEISAWFDADQSSKDLISEILSKSTIKQRRVSLDESLLKNRLSFSTAQGLVAKSKDSESLVSEIQLPLPDGNFVTVQAIPSKVISSAMAESHPDIKTWNIIGLDDPEISGVIDFTTNGFSGMLLMPDGDTIFIDPDTEQAGDVYKVFSKRENFSAFNTEFNCGVHDSHDYKSHLTRNKFSPTAATRALNKKYFTPTGAARALSSPNFAATATATALNNTDFAVTSAATALNSNVFPNLSVTGTRTYRLALSGTAEYTASQGGVAGARSSMVTSVNRINPIFIRDLGVSLELIDAPEFIFSDIATDPFSDPNNPSALMRENGDFLSEAGRLDDFDIGHVLSRSSTPGGAGVAFLGVACENDVNTSNLGLVRGIKAAGASTAFSPLGTTFDLVLLAHELGHQLGANHSHNSNANAFCSSQRSAALAVEPGSGTTIMAYSGLCGSDNLLPSQRDDFFHFAGISQINSFTRTGRGSACGVSSLGGSLPTANAGADLKIPANTPFLLDGTASGGTASWDQIDIGSASAVNVDTGDNAIIRHNIPTSEQDRYIPSLANLFAGTTRLGEIVPTTSRELNFAYVVRSGGNVASDAKAINVTNTNSTFSVTSQASGETISTNQDIQVSWDSANTNVAPISCSTVDIQLIRENGVRNMLLAATPNDESQILTVPNATPIMSGARIFVGCSDNSFFNISSGSITVQQGSAPVEPTPVEPTPTEPTPTEPTPTEPTPTEPTPTEPTPTEPTPTEPTPTEPTPTEPTPAEPTPTEPTPTEPTPAPIVPIQADTTPPVISLIGDSEITLELGQEFIEPGFSASDASDGTTTVTVTGLDELDINTAGEYIITYTTSDAAGNSSIEQRTITVASASSPIVNDISGNGGGGGGGSFSYLLLPLMILLGLRRPKPVRIKSNSQSIK